MSDALGAMSNSDRRCSPRFNISLAVTFSIKGRDELHIATVDNMSLGGVLLLTDESLAQGTEIVIRIPLDENDTATVDATIVRTSSVGEFGVAFISLSDEQMDRLSSFVEKRAPAR